MVLVNTKIPKKIKLSLKYKVNKVISLTNKKKLLIRITNLKYLIIYKFVNLLIKNGKKDLALRLFTDLCYNIFSKYNIDPLFFIINSILKVSPPFRLKKKRIAGRNYFIPLSLTLNKRLYYGLKILINVTKDINKNNSKCFIQVLEDELLNIWNNSNNSKSLKIYNQMCLVAIENKYYIKYL